jgi:hypothetical protein
MEFQDPAVTCCGEPDAKSDRNGDRGRSSVARHSANNPGFRHTPVGGGNCCSSGDLSFRRHRHDDHDGNIIDGNRSVHKARPDVLAAAHAHSLHGKAFSNPHRLLDPLTQGACQFYNHHGLYDDFGGVVTDREEGARIGKAPMHAEILAEQPDLPY